MYVKPANYGNKKRLPAGSLKVIMIIRLLSADVSNAIAGSEVARKVIAEVHHLMTGRAMEICPANMNRKRSAYTPPSTG